MPSTPAPTRFSETARSGIRMLLAVPVVVYGKNDESQDFRESTQTVVVNRTGCKILTAQRVGLGQRLTLSIGNGKRETAATVVWLGEKKGSKIEAGLDIDQTENNFWGVQFPDDSGTFQANALAAKARAEAASQASQVTNAVSLPPTTLTSTIPPISPEPTAPVQRKTGSTPEVSGAPPSPAAALPKEIVQDQLNGALAEFNLQLHANASRVEKAFSEKISNLVSQAVESAMESALAEAGEKIQAAVAQMAAQHVQICQEAFDRMAHGADIITEEAERRMDTRMHEYEKRLSSAAGQFFQTLARKLSTATRDEHHLAAPAPND